MLRLALRIALRIALENSPESSLENSLEVSLATLQLVSLTRHFARSAHNRTLRGSLHWLSNHLVSLQIMHCLTMVHLCTTPCMLSTAHRICPVAAEPEWCRVTAANSLCACTPLASWHTTTTACDLSVVPERSTSDIFIMSWQPFNVLPHYDNQG